jgi:hypothetical protein
VYDCLSYTGAGCVIGMSSLKLINADSAAVELDDHGVITWTILAVSFGVDFYVLQRSVHQINENRVSL